MKLKQAIVPAAIALAMTGCGTSHLSRGITPEGWVNGDIVFPDKDSATLKEGTFPNPAGLKQLSTGVTKDQVYELIGRPHFREGVFGVREWDYLFHFRGTGGTYATCQYKIVFSKDGHAQSFFPYPEACGPALEDFEVTPAEADQLIAQDAGAAGGRHARAAAAAEQLIGVITISGDETPQAVQEAAKELVGIITISGDDTSWPAAQEAAKELVGVITISGDETPEAVRQAARQLVGIVTISEDQGDQASAAGGVDAGGGSTVASGTVGGRKELSADMLFDFGTDSVTPAGLARLLQLADSIKSSGLRHVVIEGHSDRIGSDAYNLGLSQRRANAVRQVLEAAGVAGDVVAQGLGRTAPKVQCAEQPRNELIACLAPNRRVVVIARG